MFVYSLQNLATVNFAQHDVLATHCGYRIHHSPSIAMKLRQCVQVRLSVVDTHVPTKRCSVEPQIAMCELHSLWPSSSSTRVIDCCRCIFIRRPRLWLSIKFVENLVRLGSNHKAMLRCYASKCFIKLWVNQQYLGATMLNDVCNFIGNKPKIDWR